LGARKEDLKQLKARLDGNLIAIKQLGLGCHFLKINLNSKLVEKEVTKIH